MALVISTNTTTVTKAKRTWEVTKEKRRRCTWAPITGGGTPSKINELPVSPNEIILQRQREKAEIVEINKILAEYIGRTEAYKTENERLKEELASVEAKLGEIREALKSTYDEEIKRLRQKAEDERVAKESAIGRLERTEAELKETKSILEIEKSDHESLKERIPRMERLICEREAQIEYLTKMTESMEMEVKRSKHQQLELKTELLSFRQISDDDAIARIELESQLQSKEDELNFLASAHEEWRRSVLPFDVASEQYAREFSNELSSTLRDIRAEYEAILNATQSQNTDAWYKKKFEQLISMSKNQSGEIEANKKKVTDWRDKYDALNRTVKQIESQSKINAEKVSELTRLLAKEEDEHEATREELAAEQRDKYDQVKSLTDQLRELTDIRLRLNEEIVVYRRLMDTFSATTLRTISQPFPSPENEEEFYSRYFNEHDQQKKGMIPAEALTAAPEWMAKNGKGNRTSRTVDEFLKQKILFHIGKDEKQMITFEEFKFFMEAEKIFDAKLNFEKADSERSGFLPKDQVISILSSSGFSLEDESLLLRFSSHDSAEESFLQRLFNKTADQVVSYFRLLVFAFKSLGLNELDI